MRHEEIGEIGFDERRESEASARKVDLGQIRSC